MRSNVALFHPCATMMATSAPANCVGYQNAASGIAYASFFSYAISNTIPDYRAIMGVQLINPLIIGQKYFISMKVSRADGSNKDKYFFNAYAIALPRSTDRVSPIALGAYAKASATACGGASGYAKAMA